MTVTELNLASWNVQTLGQGVQGVWRRCEIRNFLRKARPQPNIILFQEHHYPMEDCLSLTSQLQFKGGSSVWNNALYDANGARFSGGTGISLSREFSNLLIDSSVLVEG